jgi:hypothetical protein
MKRVFSVSPLAAAVVLAAAVGACGDDSNPTDGGGAGSVSGKVTFVGGPWPATGEVQVSIYSSLTPPDYAPTGPPDAFTNPIAPTIEYNYRLDGLDNGSYAGVLVSWRDPANPSGARMLGLYWIYPDSVAIEPGGLAAKAPGPTTIVINSTNPSHPGLDITADLDLAP